jgi:hypothetical protein
MARLSIEHYRANTNMTPDRKTSRLRGMFKSRYSTGNPLAADVSTNSPDGTGAVSPPTSPISPSVKPGFEKVGLLPSERESLVDLKRELLDNGGKRVAEVLDKQEVELIDADAVHGADAVEVKTGGEMNVITEASQNALALHRTDGLDDLEEELSSALRRLNTDDDSARDSQLHTPLEQLIAPSQKFASVTEDGKARLNRSFIVKLACVDRE